MRCEATHPETGQTCEASGRHGSHYARTDLPWPEDVVTWANTDEPERDEVGPRVPMKGDTAKMTDLARRVRDHKTDPVPQAPTPGTAQERVYALLSAYRGSWVSTDDIRAVGGSEAPRRARELRADGHPIEIREHEHGPADYRLAPVDDSMP